MTDITTTQWRYFIKLTLVNTGGDNGFDGFFALDVNQKVNLIWNETNKFTTVLIGDGKVAVAVKETPDEIVSMVDARIEEDKAKRQAEHEEVMKAYQASKKDD